ncbi:hypothetical protein HJD18_01955 [Thermoleophilia bacterium SCSIO 60948]|nr:hypothetical protein HJD18_01955 [Thermoleophilia bacterium SCSIO 60948]
MSAAGGVLARVLARLVGFALMLALAAGGLALAVFSIEGGDATLSLAGLADRLGLPAARDEVAAFLARLTDGGGVDVGALVAGVAAVLFGLLIAFGALSRAREREFGVELEGGGDSSADATSKAAAQAAELRAATTSGVSAVKAKPRLSKRRRRLDVALITTADADAETVRERAEVELEPLGRELGAAIRVRAKAGDEPAKTRVR